jgi:hypothetical protein
MNRRDHRRIAKELALALGLNGYENWAEIGADLPDLDLFVGEHRRTFHNIHLSVLSSVIPEEKMKEKGFETIEQLEAEVNRLRGIVADPIELGVEESQLLEEELPPKRWKRVPEVEYEIPVLPVEELKEPERSLMIGWLAMALDAEGSLDEMLHGMDKVTKIDRWTYKYEYIRPRITFASITYELIEKWCRLVGRKVPEKRPIRFKYEVSIVGERAIAYLLLTRPYLIRLKDKAEEFLKKYKIRPSYKIK